jgi:hypothetical protein
MEEMRAEQMDLVVEVEQVEQDLLEHQEQE